MTRDEAARLLGVPADASRSAVEAAFKSAVRSAHPDLGGDGTRMAQTVDAREVLLRARGSAGVHPQRSRVFVKRRHSLPLWVRRLLPGGQERFG